MITKNFNNAGLFKDIEGSKKHVESKQMKQDRIALVYFVEDNNTDEAELYSASDVLFKNAGDDSVLVARILAVTEKYYFKESIVLSIEDMKFVMGKYVADNDFSDEAVEFAKEAIRGYEISVRDGSRIVMLPIETYARAIK